MNESYFKKLLCHLHKDHSVALIKTNSTSDEVESFPFHLHIMNHDWVWIYGTNKCFKPSFWFICLYVSKFLQSLDIGADNSILRKVDCTHHVNSLYKLGPKCNVWFTFMGSLSHIIEKHYRFTLSFTWGTWLKINVYTQKSQ